MRCSAGCIVEVVPSAQRQYVPKGAEIRYSSGFTAFVTLGAEMRGYLGN